MFLAIFAAKSGLMFTEPPEIWQMEHIFESFCFAFEKERGFKTTWPSYEKFWEACRGINVSEPELPLFFDEFSKQKRELANTPGRVLALSQKTSLTTFPSSEKPGERSDYIIYHAAQPVGFGYFDDLGCRQQEMLKERQFLALSITRIAYLAEHFAYSSVLDGIFGEEWCVFHSGNPSNPETEPIIVMVIEETQEKGVFRRIGLGIIVLGEWIKVNRKQCSIVLE
ncbi:hypothetical protein BC567DRAFT_259011 [Phyllosticta citribraziliensis]